MSTDATFQFVAFSSSFWWISENSIWSHKKPRIISRLLMRHKNHRGVILNWRIHMKRNHDWKKFYKLEASLGHPKSPTYFCPKVKDKSIPFFQCSIMESMPLAQIWSLFIPLYSGVKSSIRLFFCKSMCEPLEGFFRSQSEPMETAQSHIWVTQPDK